MIKIALTVLGVTLIAVACDSSDQQAANLLDQARVAFSSGRPGEAKQLIDSLRSNYPKAFKSIKASYLVMDSIVLSANRQTLNFCDSMLIVKDAQIRQLKSSFRLEKNKQYGTTGIWVLPSQSTEKTVQRSYLRCGVDETGRLFMTSIYYGTSPLNHTQVRIKTTDGYFAQTENIPYDGGTNYRSSYDGIREMVTYLDQRSGGVMQFIAAQPPGIEVEYTGGKRPFRIRTDKETKIAMERTLQLAGAIADFEALKREHAQAIQQIAAIENKSYYNTKP